MRRIFLESGSVVCPAGRSPLLLLLAAAVECDTVALAPVAVDTVKFLMCKFCTANQQFFSVHQMERYTSNPSSMDPGGSRSALLP